MTALTKSPAEVIKELGLEAKDTRNPRYIYVTCPFCGKPKLSINFVKDGTWSCFHCNEKGTLKGLYWKLQVKAPVPLAIELPAAKPFTAGKDSKLDKVYRAFRDRCPLNEKHRSNLLGRGLNPVDLIHFGSLPENAKARWNMCRALHNQYDLSDVPGFTQKTSQTGQPYWDTFHQGILVPVYDRNQKLVWFQIRSDCTEPGATRYYSFSYSGQTCVRSLHLPGSGPNLVVEGILKAWVTKSFLPSFNVFGIAGIQAYKSLPELKRTTYLAYDMEDKVEVTKALNKAREQIEKTTTVHIVRWPERWGKGIDDACKHLVDHDKQPFVNLRTGQLKPAE